MKTQNKDLKYMKKVLQKNIKEFNLSDRIFPMGQKVLMLEDVKQAIKVIETKRHCIKTGLHKCRTHPEDCELVVDWDDIDKIMGEGLIK